MTIHVHLTKVGNSRGIRIPSAILDQIDLEGELDLVIQDGALVIRPASRPRQGWEETFINATTDFTEDVGLVEPPLQNRFDDEEWTW